MPKFVVLQLSASKKDVLGVYAVMDAVDLADAVQKAKVSLTRNGVAPTVSKWPDTLLRPFYVNDTQVFIPFLVSGPVKEID